MTVAEDFIQVDRIVRDTFDLVSLPSPTGNTVDVAAKLSELLSQAGATVRVHEFVPNNPTVVASYGATDGGKTIIFNGHMDTIPLEHDAPRIADNRIYGRGACDMKASLACFVEMVRVLRESQTKLNGRIVLVSNSLHESPGGRGEDLYAWASEAPIHANGVIVMEGAVSDCAIAQFGSATFNITIERAGEPSHQLYTAPGTPHPISVLARVIEEIDAANQILKTQPVEDIGAESYFVGSVHSGEFYNQMPKLATLEGVRRYAPFRSYESVREEFDAMLQAVAAESGTRIHLELKKVRDGYRIQKDSPLVKSLLAAVRTVKGFELPLVGKQLVTDAGIFANELQTPTVCYGPGQTSAHAAVEYVEISDLKATTAVYVKLLEQLFDG